MKVLLYSEGQKLLAKSGIGKALEHQKQALQMNNVDFTLNPNDNFDVVHINTFGPGSYLFAKKAKKHGKRVVVHAHSTEEDFKNSFLFSNQIAPLYKKWLIKMYNSGHVIITPTDYSKKLLEAYGIKKPIYAISNGIDLEFYKTNENTNDTFREKYGFAPDDKIVMGVGLYIERKGILDFVEIAKRMPQYKFIWFGSLNLKLVPHNIKEAVKTKLPNLSFPGYINSKELKEAYRETDLFFFSTQEETEGIVLLEALASKQKVLVRDIDIYREWFKEDIHVYKGRTVDEFEIKINDILEGKLPDITENAYKLAQEKDIKNIGKQLKEVYESL